MNMGCDYCLKGKPISTKNRKDIGIELHVGAKHLIAYGKDENGWDTSVSVPIKCCPMCGEKLEDKK
jgi:hypothetical protein